MKYYGGKKIDMNKEAHCFFSWTFINSMLNLNAKTGKKRMLSIEKKRLSLSGSKISISSLSSNLVKFF